MYNRPLEPVDTLPEVYCDICKCDCRKQINSEFAVLRAVWGYESNKDTERHETHLCEQCYDKVTAFIVSLGGTVGIENYM